MTSPGTLIVRQVLDAQGRVTKVTLMAKQAPGYDPTLGDWWFGVTDPAGVPLEDASGPQVGRMTAYHGCHIPRAQDDYLLSSLLIGGVWFSPILFARAWQREAGLTDDQLRRGAGKALGSAFVLALIIALTSACSWAATPASRGAPAPARSPGSAGPPRRSPPCTCSACGRSPAGGAQPASGNATRRLAA